jgi:hypothetical protein
MNKYIGKEKIYDKHNLKITWSCTEIKKWF